MNENIPFPRAYWVFRGKLLAGFFPGAKVPHEEQDKMAGLINAGIRHIINLMEEDERDHEGELFTPYQKRYREVAAARGINVTWERMSIRDVSVPTEQGMVRILDSIDGALARDCPVYVHCWGGKGRTGTVVGCYLIRQGYATGKEALEIIKKLRRHDLRAHEQSPETHQQRDFVLHWQQGK